MKSVARSRSGIGKDLKRILEASIEKDPDDEDANEILSSLYLALGDFETLKVFTEKRIERGKATFNDYNSLAWSGLFQDTLPEKALEYGRKAVKMSQSQSYGSLHTLATLYAEVGRCEEARDILHKTLEQRNSPTLSGEDWYVVGRMAEHYGSIPSAVHAYLRIKAPVSKLDENTGSWTLAQRRLKVLADQGVDVSL